MSKPAYTKHNTNKGKQFPPNPIKAEDIDKLLRACEPLMPPPEVELSAIRLRALIVLLWRTGLRINEALALEERDLLRQDMAIVVRHGKGDRRKPRLVAMDELGWQELESWLEVREELPNSSGKIFCIVRGQSAGIRALSDGDARRQLRVAAKRAGIKRSVNAQSFRHEHALELLQKGKNLKTVQQQLGYSRQDLTAVYLKSIAPEEMVEPLVQRKRRRRGSVA